LDGRFKRRFLAPLARTQDMLDSLMKPPEFILAEKYAAICKTVALAILYGPVLPVSYLIALVGMASTYWWGPPRHPPHSVPAIAGSSAT